MSQEGFTNQYGSDPVTRLGELSIEYRKKHNLSQSQMAKKVGVGHPSWISLLERTYIVRPVRKHYALGKLVGGFSREKTLQAMRTLTSKYRGQDPKSLTKKSYPRKKKRPSRRKSAVERKIQKRSSQILNSPEGKTLGEHLDSALDYIYKEPQEVSEKERIKRTQGRKWAEPLSEEKEEVQVSKTVTVPVYWLESLLLQILEVQGARTMVRAFLKFMNEVEWE